MEQDKLDFFKNLLNEQKEKITKLINQIGRSNDVDSMEKYFSELSSYDNHPADLGTEMFMMEHDMGLKNKYKYILYDIESALDKIKEGKYGICEICHNKIPEERLKFIPYARFCLNCSEKNVPPEMKMDFNREKNANRYEAEQRYRRHKKNMKEKKIKFDKEDSYQSVARFNKISKDPSFSTGDDQGIFDDVEDGIVEDVEKIPEDYYKDTL